MPCASKRLPVPKHININPKKFLEFIKNGNMYSNYFYFKNVLYDNVTYWNLYQVQKKCSLSIYGYGSPVHIMDSRQHILGVEGAVNGTIWLISTINCFSRSLKYKNCFLYRSGSICCTSQSMMLVETRLSPGSRTMIMAKFRLGSMIFLVN